MTEITRTPSDPIFDKKNALRGSFVNPNAKCPVCRCPVYYYESPDGGKVYFDDLGPPWPKHACTDSRSSGVSSHSLSDSTTRWDKKGWEPLVDFQVTLIADRNLYKVQGQSTRYERSILFRLNASLEVEIVRFHEGLGVDVSLSLLARDPVSREWLICEGKGKLAPNYPPTDALTIVKRIPYDDMEGERDVSFKSVRTAAEALVATASSLTVPEPALNVAETLAFPFPFDRVEEIDQRIKSLLEELARLNEKKTRLINVYLKQPTSRQR